MSEPILTFRVKTKVCGVKLFGWVVSRHIFKRKNSLVNLFLGLYECLNKDNTEQIIGFSYKIWFELLYLLNFKWSCNLVTLHQDILEKIIILVLIYVEKSCSIGKICNPKTQIKYKLNNKFVLVEKLSNWDKCERKGYLILLYKQYFITLIFDQLFDCFSLKNKSNKVILNNNCLEKSGFGFQELLTHDNSWIDRSNI